MILSEISTLASRAHFERYLEHFNGRQLRPHHTYAPQCRFYVEKSLHPRLVFAASKQDPPLRQEQQRRWSDLQIIGRFAGQPVHGGDE